MRVTLIQGGGTGLDMAAVVKRVIAAAGVSVDWDEHVAGWSSVQRGGVALPDDLYRSIRDTGLVLKTKLLPNPDRPEINLNLELRRALHLFASVRPIKNLAGLPSRYSNVDLLVVRELTEDLYASIEHTIVPGVVQSIKVVTEAACRRFFRFALEWATRLGRKQVHCVHKANILKLADGLLLETFRSEAKNFPHITAKEIIVDNCCMQLVSKPRQFDVLVMGNLYGDLISDLGAGIVGGVSATHGINHGDGVTMFESFFGGNLEDIGPNRVNPLPLLLPAIDLLESQNQADAGKRIQNAIEKVLTEGRVRTADLGGDATTSAMGDAIIQAL